ncbi:MAG: MFS transporter [Gemmatimonadales bacterium]
MLLSRSRLGVILLTVFVDLVGFGIVLPILPYYAQQFGAHGLGFGAVVFIYSAMQFLATAVLGKLSDRWGRRPVILATTLVNAAGYGLFAFAGSYTALFVSRLISGVAGGNIAAAQAYIADVTSPVERSRGMGLLGAAFGVGFILGPAIGGLAGHYGGPAAPGLVAAGLSLVNFVSAYFILDESLRAEHRVARGLLDFGHMREALTRPRLRPLMLIFAIVPFAFSGYMVALPLHAATAFGWGSREMGWFFTIVGIVAAVVQGYVFGQLARRTNDRTIVITATFGMVAGIAPVPLLGSTAALYAWTFVLAFANSIGGPALTGLISVYSAPLEQGTMLGVAQAFGALGRSAGPLVMGVLYDGLGARFAFVAAAGFMLCSAVVALGLEPAPHAVRAAPGRAGGEGDHVPPA